MSKIIEIKIKNPKRIYQELARQLAPYRDEPAGSIIFIVEGTKNNPIIGLRYPGKKLKNKQPKMVRSNSNLYANLYDFEVIPYQNGKEIETQNFTFEELMKDFQNNKKGSQEFWTAIEELYQNNRINKKIPDLPGIDPGFYLLVLKWIWIQEDFNYRFGWQEVNSPSRYVLENRTVAKSVGRARFFAVLILLKNNFTFEQIKKINSSLLAFT